MATIWLLAGSCGIAALILLSAPAERPAKLSDLAMADSLILQELALFNISTDNIRVREYSVSDQFTRKRYSVDLPVQVSKTHLHAELNRQFRQHGVSSTGFVNVPENEMTLHLFYNDKVIRTLDLRTNPEYVRVPHPASLLIYFDRRPTASQLNRIREIGIPAGIVLRSASRRSIVRWAETLSEDISGVAVWYENAGTAFDDPDYDHTALYRTLEEVGRIHDHPVLLDFSSNDAAFSTDLKEQLRSINVTVAGAGDMIILSSDNRFEFDRKMLAYSRIARQAGVPRMLVRASDRTLDWLEEWIPRIKRGGVVFVSIQSSPS